MPSITGPPHPPPGEPRYRLGTHTTRREMIQDTMVGRGPSPGEDAAARGRRWRQQALQLAAAVAVGSAEHGVAAVKGEVPAAAAGRGRWRLLKGRPRCSARPPKHLLWLGMRLQPQCPACLYNASSFSLSFKVEAKLPVGTLLVPSF